MTWKEGRVLVTGATGFVGANLARRLVDEGAEVVAGVRRPEALEVEGASPVRLDLMEPATFDAAVEGVDVVFHVAAWVGFGDDSKAMRINVEGSRALFEAASRAGARRYVQFSTCGVLGLNPPLPIDGSTPPDPQQQDVYHRSKALMEAALREAAQGSDIELVILRPGIVYGPGSRGWTAGMLKLVKKGTPVVFGKGDGLAFPTYIDNLVDATLRAGQAEDAGGKTFHIVDTTVPWKQWFGFFGDMCGRKPRALPLAAAKVLAFAGEKLPLGIPLDREKLALMQTRYQFANQAEREILAWEPRVSLEQGMQAAEQWLRETGRLPTERQRR